MCVFTTKFGQVMRVLIGPFPLSHFKSISCPLVPDHLFHKFPQNCKSTWKLCTFLREALPIATPHFRLVGKKIKHQPRRQNIMPAVNFSTNLKYVHISGIFKHTIMTLPQYASCHVQITRTSAYFHVRRWTGWQWMLATRPPGP